MLKRYKLLVIGGGTGGLRVALAAASQGLKTVLIEPGPLGGTCLNTGCIPTKTLLQSTHVYQLVRNAKLYGVHARGVKADFPVIMKRMHRIVQEGQDHIRKTVPHHKNITLLRTPARFVSSDTIQVGNELVTAEKILIATGSKSMILPLPGLEKVRYLLNDDLLHLTQLPKSILLIGGGYISMEFATFYNELGCRVVVLERLPRVLSLLDPDVTDYLTRIYTQQGIRIHTNVNILGVEERNGKKIVVANDVRKPSSKKTRYTADVLALTAGRTPNTQGLNLEAAGIQLSPKKNIQVNEYFQTSNPHVYAIGDVTGLAPFAHSAKREASLILENMFGKKTPIHVDLCPYAVFTNPPIAGVGLTEQQLQEKKIPYALLKADYARTGRSRILENKYGFVKVLYDPKTRKILGCTILGPHADDLIHEYAAVMNSSSPTIDVIQNTIHIHPTLAEVNESLEEG